MARSMGTGLSLAIVALALSGCASGDHYVNPSYPRSRLNAPTVAVVPVPVAYAPQADGALEAAFAGDARRTIGLGVSPAVVRRRIGTDAELARGIDAASAKMLETASDPSRAGTLREILGENGMARLRRHVEPSNLVLWPAAFAIRESAGLTLGTAVYRLYDLESGELVYQSSHALDVSATGDAGRVLMARALAGAGRSAYERNFLDAR